jgi:hypothetical protein
MCAKRSLLVFTTARPIYSSKYLVDVHRFLSRREAASSGKQFSVRRAHAQRRQPAAINDGLSIDEHLDLAITPARHLHILAQFPTKPRRHPDGVQPGSSIRAVAAREWVGSIP